MKYLEGKKTYLLGVVGVVWAIAGWLLGNLEPQSAMEVAWAALTAMAVRAGIKKAEA